MDEKENNVDLFKLDIERDKSNNRSMWNIGGVYLARVEADFELAKARSKIRLLPLPNNPLLYSTLTGYSLYILAINACIFIKF